MRVFLTGATGYIGSAVLDALLRAGHEVTALVRSGAAADRVARHGVHPLRGDLAVPTSYAEAAADHDAYIHTAFDGSERGPAIEALTVETLAAAAARVPSALIYTSGIWVLGPSPTPAVETSPLNPTPLVAWRPAVEARVLEAATPTLRTMVVRPGIVYGGARGIISDMLTDADNGLMRVVGTGENRWPVVYDRDLGDLYARLLATGDAAGVFHATDESEETVRDIVEAVAAHAPSRPDVRFMPLGEARKKRGAVADALVLDQVVRSPRARALGWTPTLGSVTRNIPRLYEEWRNARQERDA
jgi:nucleoside-diphosphate-sugar epimerase